MREDICKGRNERCSSCNGKTHNKKEWKGVDVKIRECAREEERTDGGGGGDEGIMRRKAASATNQRERGMVQ
jgi:hypothetical protein